MTPYTVEELSQRPDQLINYLQILANNANWQEKMKFVSPEQAMRAWDRLLNDIHTQPE